MNVSRHPECSQLLISYAKGSKNLRWLMSYTFHEEIKSYCAERSRHVQERGRNAISWACADKFSNTCGYSYVLRRRKFISAELKKSSQIPSWILGSLWQTDSSSFSADPLVTRLTCRRVVFTSLRGGQTKYESIPLGVRSC